MNKILLRVFRLIFFALVILSLAVFLFTAYKVKTIEDNGYHEPEKVEFRVPDFSRENELDYRWTYNSQQYSVNFALYQSAYDFYRGQSKVYEYQSENLPEGWENEYLGIFLRKAENDSSIESLVEKIATQGEARKLSSDQMAELTVAFVQSLPYDDDKARLIMSSEDKNNPSALPRYPYETLFEKKGVCSDKSLLAYLMVRQLGYGAALFVYPSANHMALGIQCPLEYSENNFGYCYAETTTAGHIIGIVPKLDENRKAIPVKEKTAFENTDSSSPSDVMLENPEIYQKTTGEVYGRVATTFKTQKEIDRLEKYFVSANLELSSLNIRVNSLGLEIKELDEKMDDYKKEKEYEKFNKLVPKYNDLVEDYQKLVKLYNTKTKEYNNNVNYYNRMVKELSILE